MYSPRVVDVARLSCFKSDGYIFLMKNQTSKIRMGYFAMCVSNFLTFTIRLIWCKCVYRPVSVLLSEGDLRAEKALGLSSCHHRTSGVWEDLSSTVSQAESIAFIIRQLNKDTCDFTERNVDLYRLGLICHILALPEQTVLNISQYSSSRFGWLEFSSVKVSFPELKKQEIAGRLMSVQLCAHRTY